MRCSIGLVIGAAVVLSACASTYRVSPLVADNQIQVVAPSGEAVRSSKKHVVEVGVVRTNMRQFDNPRFTVRFTNQGKDPLEFSTENVTASFNGRPATVVSYEAQLQDVQNRLSFYGLRAPVFYTPFRSPFYYPPFGGHHGGFVIAQDFNDRLDVQQALADFDYIQQFSLKPKVVRPGQETFGEIVVGAKLGASSSQDMVVTVDVDGEQHSFTFGYDQLN
ncbi:MAG TPA: hypothetical protein VFV57_01955 [Limnobacter sp.]|nr:hypothetical protein [Limnobacter sp.]